MDKTDFLEGTMAACVVIGLLFGLMLFDNPVLGVFGGAALAIIVRLVLPGKAKKKKAKAMMPITRGKWAIMAGIAILTIGIFAAIYMPLTQMVKSTIISVGTAMLAVGALLYWRARKGEVLADERTIKISNRALGASWWLTYVFVAALFWADSTGAAKFTMESFAGLLLFEMIVTYMVAKWWLERQGDA
ncbi:Uncharacterised protein [Candidatus Anstonella stagnisolia]|nr:Uncharacterised protein [Candidatus Anstonella stagnisolia]